MTEVFFSETQKIRSKVFKFVQTPCVDFGCGGDKIIPDAIGVDLRPMDGVNLVTNLDGSIAKAALVASKGTFRTVYSSHFLEHVKDDVAMVRWWTDLLMVGGHLILYLPDDDHYDNAANPEHLHWYKHLNFVGEFMKQFEQLKIVDHGLDVGYDRYSFYMVARRLL